MKTIDISDKFYDDYVPFEVDDNKWIKTYESLQLVAKPKLFCKDEDDEAKRDFYNLFNNQLHTVNENNLTNTDNLDLIRIPLIGQNNAVKFTVWYSEHYKQTCILIAVCVENIALDIIRANNIFSPKLQNGEWGYYYVEDGVAKSLGLVNEKMEDRIRYHLLKKTYGAVYDILEQDMKSSAKNSIIKFISHITKMTKHLVWFTDFEILLNGAGVLDSGDVLTFDDEVKAQMNGLLNKEIIEAAKNTLAKRSEEPRLKQGRQALEIMLDSMFTPLQKRDVMEWGALSLLPGIWAKALVLKGNGWDGKSNYGRVIEYLIRALNWDVVDIGEGRTLANDFSALGVCDGRSMVMMNEGNYIEYISNGILKNLIDVPGRICGRVIYTNEWKEVRNYASFFITTNKSIEFTGKQIEESWSAFFRRTLAIQVKDEWKTARLERPEHIKEEIRETFIPKGACTSSIGDDGMLYFISPNGIDSPMTLFRCELIVMADEILKLKLEHKGLREVRASIYSGELQDTSDIMQDRSFVDAVINRDSFEAGMIADSLAEGAYIGDIIEWSLTLMKQLGYKNVSMRRVAIELKNDKRIFSRIYNGKTQYTTNQKLFKKFSW